MSRGSGCRKGAHGLPPGAAAVLDVLDVPAALAAPDANSVVGARPACWRCWPRRTPTRLSVRGRRACIRGVDDTRRRLLAIMLFDDVEELDAVGPWEVLAYWTRTWPDDGFEVCCASADGRPVRAAKGLEIGAHRSFADIAAAGAVGELAMLLHPGGQGTRPQLRDDAYLAYVRARAAEVDLLASVCTGSLVLAAAGLLRGRPATTHWASLELLAELDPTIEVRAEDRFVDDGDVLTSAGVSAGIDLALHLVARLASPERARQVRRGIQYDPQPPV